MSSVPKAVPSAVAPASGGDTIPILTDPQLGPGGTPALAPGRPRGQVIPVVPRTEGDDPADLTPHHDWAGEGGDASQLSNGSGAPSVPVDGFLFKQGPIDAHYTSETQAVNPNGGLQSPYAKVNNPPTRGMFTRVQSFLNHIAQTPQDVDANGFRISPPQQRTSVMLNTLPPHGGGYAPETATPHINPQRPNTAKFLPATGTQPYGYGPRGYGGVLNSDSFGAGQTAGGIGGNNYPPQPGPPATTSTAGGTSGGSEPTWG